MSDRVRRRRQEPAIEAPPRVVVVGHCGAGKSSVVAGLRARGIDAVASAQEHSIVADLWRRRGADLLLYLEVDLETLRDRRGRHWPQAIYDVQETRLGLARQSADLLIDTGAHDLLATLDVAETFVNRWRRTHGSRRATNPSISPDSRL